MEKYFHKNVNCIEKAVTFVKKMLQDYFMNWKQDSWVLYPS
jgi:hypothetical protein